MLGYLCDAERGLAQKECGLHKKQLVDVVHHRTTARHLTDDTREVGGGDTQFGGVKTDVVVLDEMLGQQTEEAEEDFLDALGEAVLADTVLLDVGKVSEEEVLEHPQAVVGQRESHLLIVNHHLH